MFDEAKNADRLLKREIALRAAYDRGRLSVVGRPENERHRAGLFEVERWVLEDLELGRLRRRDRTGDQAVRQSQLATLRAIQAGAVTVPALVLHLGKSWQQALARVAPLASNGYVDRYTRCGIEHFALTAKARDLLARRAELDGET